MKRFSATLLSILIFALSIFGTGCLLVEENWDRVNINIVLCDGTYENVYFLGAAERFESYAESNYYADSYQGVNVDVIMIREDEFQLKNQSFSDYDIYVTTENMGSYPRLWAKDGYVLSLNEVFVEGSDVVNNSSVSVEEKLHPNALNAYLNDSFEYCAVPHASQIVGLSYDVNSFERNGFYFAEDTTDAYKFYSEIIGEYYYFVNPVKGINPSPTNKTVGVDGVYGTEDDGLPSTVNEFVALCEYIKAQDKYPFISSGKDGYKADYLVQALTTALMGAEEARTCMNLQGKLQVVTGFTSEPLFKGLDSSIGQIYKPIVQTVEVSETCGYYTSWSVAKYYAEAFLELSLKMDWWADNSYNETSSTSQTIYDFIFSGYDQQKQEALMLCESSAWYKILEEEGHINYFNSLYNRQYDNERKIRWMSMPTLLDGTESYASERNRQTYQQVSPTYLVVANQVMKSTAKTEACVDFLKFLCTELECNYYTVATGLRKDFDYDFNLLDLYGYSEYYASLEQEIYYADIVHLSSTSNTFKDKPEYFEGGKKDKRFFYYEKIVYEDEFTEEVVKAIYDTAFEYFAYFRNPSAKECLKNRLYDKSSWNLVYSGYLAPTEYVGQNGKPVIFNG